jgi:hypothetical protein
MNNGTFVISAFPACGKSYCFNHYQDKYSMLDSDSSEFSWVKDENGNNTKERNPEFPSNYIKHIKENIGKVDIIFVSSHDVARKALAENDIKVIMVYPSKNMKEEWMKRFEDRGNTEAFMNFISDNWDNFIDDIENEDNDFYKVCLCSEKAYININLLNDLYDISKIDNASIYLNY